MSRFAVRSFKNCAEMALRISGTVGVPLIVIGCKATGSAAPATVQLFTDVAKSVSNNSVFGVLETASGAAVSLLLLMLSDEITLSGVTSPERVDSAAQAGLKAAWSAVAVTMVTTWPAPA